MKKIVSIMLALTLVVSMLGINALAVSHPKIDFQWTNGTSLGDVGVDLQDTYDYDFFVALKLKTNATPGIAGVGGSITYDPNDLQLVAMTGLDNQGALYFGGTIKNFFGTAAYNPAYAENKAFFTAVRLNNVVTTGTLLYVMFKIKATESKDTVISFTPDAESCLAVEGTSTKVLIQSVSSTYSYTRSIDPVEHALTFNDNVEEEEITVPDEQYLLAGAEVDLDSLEAPVRDGYDFMGWSLTTDGATVSSPYVMTNSPTTLYAIWEEASSTFTLTYDANTTDEVTGIPDPVEYAEGDAVSLDAVPLRVGYNFLGWSTDGTTVLDSFIMLPEPTTLLAVWELIPATKYNLTFDPNTTDAVTGIPDPKELEAGTAVDLPILGTPVREGYEFLGWSEDGSTVVATYQMTSADDTLYAVWRLVTHIVIKDPTSTKEGATQTVDFWGNVISSTPIAMLPHFGTLRGIQVPTGAASTDATTTVRLILGINSLEYLKAGFIVAAQSNLNKDGYTPGDEFSKAITSSTVYETITTGGKTYTASEFGAKYLVVVEIANFPQSAYNFGVRFQGFAVTADGQYHFDTKTVTTVTTLIG